MRALVNGMEDKHELPHEHNIESELGEISSEVSQLSVRGFKGVEEVKP